MKREISAGGLAFRRTRDGKLKFLLIKDHTGRWSLPKGLVGDEKKDETSEEAAIREVAEEAGISEKKLKVVEKLGDIKYVYTFKWDKPREGHRLKKGDKVFKIVIFYLIESKQAKLKPQWEVQDAKWFDAKDVVDKVGYRSTRGIVKLGVERANDLLKSSKTFGSLGPRKTDVFRRKGRTKGKTKA